MQGPSAILTTAGVVVVSCIIALVIDHLLPARPKIERVLPMIGIKVHVTNRFMAIWAVSGVIVFVVSVAIGVALTQPGR